MTRLSPRQAIDPETYWGRSLIKNSPGQIVTDGAEPQWWDDVANATITDEDCAGESIADITERCYKVVTTANDVYGYQTFTFSDEDLLDAGQTVVSLGVWVWCASASKASVGIYGSNLGLEESSQHTGSSSWELLKVENITLDASDTSIQVRLIVDTGTAYFTMMMLNQGSRALPWRPRDVRYKPMSITTQFDLNTTGDVAWSDTDCTANTDPLACRVMGRIYIREPNGTLDSYIAVSHADDLIGGDSYTATLWVHVLAQNLTYHAEWACDDQQVIRYMVNEMDADSDVRAQVFLHGYWMWE